MTPIAPIESGDLADLVPLLRQTSDLHAAAHPDLYRADASDAGLPGFLSARVAADNVCARVARNAGGPIVGCAIYRIDENPRSAIRHALRAVFLDQVAVDPGPRGKGIATRLVKAVGDCGRAKGATRPQSRHAASNGASCAMMRASGMAVLGMRGDKTL